MKHDPIYMVFDVESVGLHGVGIAAGYVVVDATGRELESGHHACPWDPAHASSETAAWLKANMSVGGAQAQIDPIAVRSAFWSRWLHWRERGATLWADCAWPVEARFLAACVDDDRATNEWLGPYPLHDVATLRLAAGFDPLATEPRLEGELPAHNALADARQSARLLIDAMGRCTANIGRAR